MIYWRNDVKHLQNLLDEYKTQWENLGGPSHSESNERLKFIHESLTQAVRLLK